MNNNQQDKRRPRPGQPAAETSKRPKTTPQARSASRGEAIRAQRRAHQDADRISKQFVPAAASNENRGRANVIDDSPRLKIIGLGGMDGGGSKNMILVEYQNDAVVMDCGNDLGVD